MAGEPEHAAGSTGYSRVQGSAGRWRRPMGARGAAVQKGVGIFEIHPDPAAAEPIYILENMNTAPLGGQAWEFLFVLGRARITGAVQAIINPVAIR